MRQEKLLNLIGQIDCKFIDEANPMNHKKNMYWIKWLTAAACLVIGVFGILFGQNMYAKYNTEVSYICLDVNPSIELCLNHHDKVINAIAYNEDGQKLLGMIEHKNKHYEDVINDILHHEEFQKYLTEDLTITIVSEDENIIRQNIEDCFDVVQCDGEIVCSDSETREVAYSNHCSVGKYVAYEELAQYDSSVTLEDCKKMTMHEIHEKIDAHHSEHNSYNDEQHNAEHVGSHHSEHH